MLCVHDYYFIALDTTASGQSSNRCTNVSTCLWVCSNQIRISLKFTVFIQKQSCTASTGEIVRNGEGDFSLTHIHTFFLSLTLSLFPRFRETMIRSKKKAEHRYLLKKIFLLLLKKAASSTEQWEGVDCLHKLDLSDQRLTKGCR